MKKCLLFSLLLALCTAVSAQIVTVSYGSGYSQQAYYQLADDATVNILNTSWDIAFTAIGSDDAGIFVNEATQSGGAELELYLTGTLNFDDVIDPGTLEDRQYNDEVGWLYGAFNNARDIEDPTDYGWGGYDPGIGLVMGYRVYVLKLRDGTYKKIKIESLENGVYTFRYADPDGANEVTIAIDKTDYADYDFVHFSFATGEVVSGIPAEWDLLFTRYIYPLDNGSGTFLQYLLTGVLSGRDVEVAQADGIDPDSITPNDYLDELIDDPTVIGYDWKEFELSTFQWTVPNDRVYFIKTADSHLWQIAFVDFEGSGTGNTTFEKTDLGVLSSVEHVRAFESFDLFPNPVISEATLAFSLKHDGRVNFTLRDILGNQLWHTSVDAQAGLNVRTFPDLDLAQGPYFMTLDFKGDLVTLKIIKY